DDLDAGGIESRLRIRIFDRRTDSNQRGPGVRRNRPYQAPFQPARAQSRLVSLWRAGVEQRVAAEMEDHWQPQRGQLIQERGHAEAGDLPDIERVGPRLRDHAPQRPRIGGLAPAAIVAVRQIELAPERALAVNTSRSGEPQSPLDVGPRRLLRKTRLAGEYGDIMPPADEAVGYFSRQDLRPSLDIRRIEVAQHQNAHSGTSSTHTDHSRRAHGDSGNAGRAALPPV